MEAIYPKKQVPFNSNTSRSRKVEPNLKEQTPGPGSYQFRSEFDLNKYVKSMDENGTYLSFKNGHLNMMKQTMGGLKMSPQKKQSVQLMKAGSLSRRGNND